MVDITMWGRALDRMPKLDAEQWQALDPVARWLIACRASVLFMTFTAAALGGLMAWRAGIFSLGSVAGDNLRPDVRPRHQQPAQ